MVAARDLEPGELIFTEEALASGPDHSAPPSCLECLKTVDGSYACPDCAFPMCDEMCAYGAEHRGAECSVFAKLQPKVRYA